MTTAIGRGTTVRRIPALDLVLGALGLLMTALELTLAWRYGSRPYVLETLVSAGLTAALVLRRRFVIGSAVATFALLGVMAANVWLSGVGIGVSPLLACAPLSVVALTRYAPDRRWGLPAAVIAALASPLSPAVRLADGGWAGDLVAPSPKAMMLAVHVLVVALAYLWALRQREIAERHRRELDELARRNEVLRAEAETLKEIAGAREEIAAARERNRIAREVHDVVAHSVALIQVEAATGLAIAETEPEYARRSLETIKQASRESLTEIRYLVGVLREAGPDSPDRAPTTTVAGLPAMLDRIRSSGVHLDAELPDDDGLRALDDALDASGQLAVCRVVQESVTNAVRHGGAHTRIRVTVTGGPDDGGEGARCRVRVHNLRGGPAAPDATGRGAGGAAPLQFGEVHGDVRHGDVRNGGFGLLGLRERLDSVGGRLEHGPTADGFAVEAEVPLRAGVAS